MLKVVTTVIFIVFAVKPRPKREESIDPIKETGEGMYYMGIKAKSGLVISDLGVIMSVGRVKVRFNDII